MRLYEISNAIIESQHDEVDIEQLKQLEMAFKDKAVACAAVTKNLRAESDAVDAELKRLMKRKAAIDNNRKRLIDYLLAEMQKAGVDKVDGGLHQIRRAKSPLLIQIIDEDNVPTQFRKVVIERTVDKKAIRDHAKETGEVVDGTEVIQNEHLRIS
jgi:uncharacterized protein (UPF0216 family)